MTLETQLHGKRRNRFFICCIALGLGLLVSTLTALGQEEEPGDPPEIVIGERLFLETRFAHFFKAFLDGAARLTPPFPRKIRCWTRPSRWALRFPVRLPGDP